MKAKIKTLLKNKDFKKRFRRLVKIIGLLIILTLVASYLVVAVVNYRPISRLTLYRQLMSQSGEQMLDNLIKKELIFQEAKKQKINISQDELNGEITKLEEQLKTQGFTLETFLQYQGLSRTNFEEQIKIQLIAQKILGKDISVTDQEIEAEFKTNQATYPKGTKLETVKDEIKQKLTQSKISEKFNTWIEDLQKSAKIFYLKR